MISAPIVWMVYARLGWFQFSTLSVGQVMTFERVYVDFFSNCLIEKISALIICKISPRSGRGLSLPEPGIRTFAAARFATAAADLVFARQARVDDLSALCRLSVMSGHVDDVLSIHMNDWMNHRDFAAHIGIMINILRIAVDWLNTWFVDIFIRHVLHLLYQQMHRRANWSGTNDYLSGICGVEFGADAEMSRSERDAAGYSKFRSTSEPFRSAAGLIRSAILRFRSAVYSIRSVCTISEHRRTHSERDSVISERVLLDSERRRNFRAIFPIKKANRLVYPGGPLLL